MGLDINSSLYVLGLKDPLNDKGSIQSEIEEKVISLEHELIPLNDPFLVKLYAAFWIDQTLDAIRLLRSYDESKSQLWFIRKQLTDDIKNDPFELLEYGSGTTFGGLRSTFRIPRSRPRRVPACPTA